MEEWKRLIVDGVETNYEVSNLGRIKNTNTDRILNPSVGKNGYVIVRILNKTRNLHRLILSTFNPTTNPKLDVNHGNGNKADNRVSNLEWCTRSKNVKHAWDTGLTKLHKSRRGINNPTNKHSELTIMLACFLLSTGKWSIKETAKATGVHYMTIWRILRKQAWTHISKHFDLNNGPIKI